MLDSQSKQDKLVVLDFETSNLAVVRGKGVVHCFSLVNDDIAEVYEWCDESKQMLLNLAANGYTFIAHNAKFDKAVMQQFAGISPPFICTQVLAHTINPTLMSYSLDSLTGAKLDYAYMMETSGRWDGVSKKELYELPFNEIMAEYCLNDAQATWVLYKDLMTHLDADKRLHDSFFKVLNPFIDVMISLNGGMKIDSRALMALLGELSADVDKEYAKFLVDYPKVVKLKWNKEGKKWEATDKMGVPNLSSPNDVTSLLFSKGWVPDDFKWDTGRPVTTQNTLRRLAVTETASPQLRELANRLQQLRSLIGIRTQCISLAEIVAETGSEIIYADWRQGETVTNRMSCKAPNL
jgi:DNA polymerase I-like protein with 3'-5' exonuclease and polymerase domains